MKRKLKHFDYHIETGEEYRKPYYKKRGLFRIEKKSKIWFPFEFTLSEIMMAISMIRKRDNGVYHIEVEEVFDSFVLSNWDTITI